MNSKQAQLCKRREILQRNLIKASFLLLVPMKLLHNFSNTVEPRYNEVGYNKILL